MVNEDFNKDLKEMISEGLITLDGKGEMQLTEKGLKHTESLLKDEGAKGYMKKVAKHFNENEPNKESVNINEIADEIDLVDNTELSIYERFGIAENDDLKNYQLFCKILSKGEIKKKKILNQKGCIKDINR